MNQVHIIGNITRDVELKYAQSGTAIASMGVAVNKKVKNQSGGYDDKPVFIDVTAFGKTAETLNQYFRKGSKIGIDGELNFEQWTAQDGQKRSKLSVIMNRLHFIDKKDDSQQGGQPQQQQNYGQPQQQQQQQSYQQPQQSYQQPAQQQKQQSYQQPQQQQNSAPVIYARTDGTFHDGKGTELNADGSIKQQQQYQQHQQKEGPSQ